MIILRLWHKDLLRVLPRQQLVSQYRECCAIAKSIKEKGTPNHILVNKIMDYPMEDFITYTTLVRIEMERRGYKCNGEKFLKHFKPQTKFTLWSKNIFPNWHNDRYYWQCYFNLQEKYDNKGISQDEWDKIQRACHDRYLFGVVHI